MKTRESAVDGTPGSRETTRRHTYRVYVIQLDERVLGSSNFRDSNPLYRSGKPCVYVGYTSRSPGVRLQQHQEGGRLSSSWVKKYGQGESLLRSAYDHLPTFESATVAEAAEVRHAEALRARGWGVWQN